MRIHIVLGTLGALALAAAMALYMVQEPARLQSAQEALLASRVAEGQPVYLQNCALCHGAAGEGLGANPALATEGVAAMDYDELLKVIARGRYGTAMPAWSVAEGGPLDDAALESLALLLHHGDWADTYRLAEQLDLVPRAPVAVELPAEALAQVAALPGGATLAPAIQTYASNCIACHGSNGEGSPLAPALNDPTLRAQRTAAQLAATITYGVPGTLMAGWSQHLDPAAIDGLVQLILQWDQLEPGLVPTPQPAPVVAAVDTAALVAASEPLYAQSCATCHGTDGQGTPRAPALNVQSFFARVTNDVALAQIITLGVPGTAMPAWGDRLGSTEIDAIAAYIRAWEPTAPAVATPQRGRGLGPPWLRNP
ncbi:MAG: c-type cytochrome [Anaerolineae bacterium]|nr:c-type cytochrome [Anaerolineae bacterium]